jgi:undecaprenyl diphosphate synthase
VLLVETIVKETPTLMKNNISLLTIGDLSRLPQATRDKFLECIQQTSHNTGLKLVIALSYSARWELIQAAKNIAQEVQNGQLLLEEINEELLANHLTTADMPDPDLLIRTSGELRISNFLLWQLAYSEMYFTSCLWPEFTNEEFYHAIVDFQNRERRFGKTSEQII